MLTVRFSNPERYIYRTYENIKSLSQIGGIVTMMDWSNETSTFDLSIDGPWVVGITEQPQKIEALTTIEIPVRITIPKESIKKIDHTMKHALIRDHDFLVAVSMHIDDPLIPDKIIQLMNISKKAILELKPTDKKSVKDIIFSWVNAYLKSNKYHSIVMNTMKMDSFIFKSILRIFQEIVATELDSLNKAKMKIQNDQVLVRQALKNVSDITLNHIEIVYQRYTNSPKIVSIPILSNKDTIKDKLDGLIRGTYNEKCIKSVMSVLSRLDDVNTDPEPVLLHIFEPNDQSMKSTIGLENVTIYGFIKYNDDNLYVVRAELNTNGSIRNIETSNKYYLHDDVVVQRMSEYYDHLYMKLEESKKYGEVSKMNKCVELKTLEELTKNN